MNTKSQGDTDLFKIGLVAQETGVSVPTLRQWERRYALQPTERINSHRFYSREQVERIKQVKALSDRGHSLGQLFQLHEEEIARLFDEGVQTQQELEEDPISLILVGRELDNTFEAMRSSARLELSDRFKTFDSFQTSGLEHPEQLNEAHAIVLYQSSIIEDQLQSQLQRIRECTMIPIVLVCRYLTKKQAESVSQQDKLISICDHFDWHVIAKTAQDMAGQSPRDGRSDLPAMILQSHELEALEQSVVPDEVIKGKEIVPLIDALRSYEEYMYVNASNELHTNIAQLLSTARGAMEKAATTVIETHAILLSPEK